MSLSPEMLLRHEINGLFEAATQVILCYPELGPDATHEVIKDAQERLNQAASALIEAEANLRELEVIEALSVNGAWSGGRAEATLEMLCAQLATMSAEADFHSHERNHAA